MKLYKLERTQFLRISLEEAWEFFSSPRNLSKITPNGMGFDITNNPPEIMQPGMIITYKIKALAGIAMNWVTEITHVQEPYMFVDEQRFGPYKFWHHTHYFKEVSDGVEMRDEVYYGLPLGILGQIVHPIIVGPKLKQIFDFRYIELEKFFNK